MNDQNVYQNAPRRQDLLVARVRLAFRNQKQTVKGSLVSLYPYVDDDLIVSEMARMPLFRSIKRRDVREAAAKLMWFFTRLIFYSDAFIDRGECSMYKSLADLKAKDKGFSSWDRSKWETARRALRSLNVASVQDVEETYSDKNVKKVRIRHKYTFKADAWYTEGIGAGGRTTAIHITLDREFVESQIMAFLESEALERQAKRRGGLRSVGSQPKQTKAEASESVPESSTLEPSEITPEVVDNSTLVEANPVGSNTASTQPSVPDSATPDVIPPFFMHQGTSATDSTSHSLAALVPVVCPSPEDERERAVDFYSLGEGEREEAISQLAGELIEIQRQWCPPSKNDYPSATDMARVVLLNGIPKSRAFRELKAQIVKASQNSKFGHFGLSLVGRWACKELLNEAASELQRAERDAKLKQEIAALQRWDSIREAEQKQREAKHAEEAERRAAERALQTQELQSSLWEYSVEHGRGELDEHSERAAITYIATNRDGGFQHFKFVFDWFLNATDEQGKPRYDRVRWDFVDLNWRDFLFRNSKSKGKPSGVSMKSLSRLAQGFRDGMPSASSQTEPARPVVVRSLAGDSLLQALASICERDALTCSDYDYSDLVEAHEFISRLDRVTRRLPIDEQLTEVSAFGEWFRQKKGFAPFPLAIREHLREFREAQQ